MFDFLAAADFSNPLFLAVLVGWIMTVVLHEFAHGIVAHFGGDYTVRERGGLTLNPLQYIHPVTSILLPAVFLLIGGVPLPGGATYIRTDLLRNRAWETAVSLAGPAMNFLLFLIGVAILHPAAGWLAPNTPIENWTDAQRVVATLTFLQIYAVLLNLMPVPPLDGFGAISPYMKEETRQKLMSPGNSIVLLLVLFMVLRIPAVQRKFFGAIEGMYGLLGYSDGLFRDVAMAFRRILFG